MSGLLHEWLTAQARRRPEATAIVAGEARWSYGMLEEASNRLAHQLRALGCGRGDRVCVLAPKTPVTIAALLGVLKTDAMYVPLDLGSPAPRLAKMISACDTRWILAGGPGGALLDQLARDGGLPAGVVIGWLDEVSPEPGAWRPAFKWQDLAGHPGTALPSGNRPEDPAHILFTSGSTGVPKGVVVTHASVGHFVRWAVGYFGTASGERISGHPPLHFDLSTFDLFGTFAGGAELHLVPPELSLLPHRLAEWIRESAVTQWFSVPSVLNYLAKYDAVREGDFSALRRVLWCGEALPTATLIHWMRRLPHVTFTNLYGPTEAAIASSYYTVPSCPVDERDPIPIGRPCAGEDLRVLDADLQPLPPGEVGDLYISGVGLSPGYWRDPEKTGAAFLPKPGAPPDERMYRTGDLASRGPDGLFYFHGRADSQVKSRGYRIELGEIETALGALGGLLESAVVGVASDGFEGTAICCAYVPRPAAEVTPAELRAGLAKTLPAYMLPARWLTLPVLPKNANGKVDRPALRARFGAHAAQTA